jgi:hypothetical protein
MERPRPARPEQSAAERLLGIVKKKQLKLQRQVGNLDVARVLHGVPASGPTASLIGNKDELLGHIEAVFRREHGGALLDALVKRRRVG